MLKYVVSVIKRSFNKLKNLSLINFPSVFIHFLKFLIKIQYMKINKIKQFLGNNKVYYFFSLMFKLSVQVFLI